MQEVFEKIIEKLEDKRKTAELLIMENPHDELDRIQTQTAEDFSSAYKDAIEIVNRAAAEYNNGWIQVSERLQEEPEVRGSEQTARNICRIQQRVERV